MKRGTPHGTVAWAMRAPVAMSDADSAGHVLAEGAVKAAASRLLSVQTPPRLFPTTCGLAHRSEVYYGASQHVAYVAGACSGHPVCQSTPRRLLEAVVMYATPAVNVHNAVFSMLPAVRSCLAAFYIKARFRRAGVMRATPAAHVHHTVLRMLPAANRRLAALDVEEWLSRTGVV